MKDCMLKSLYNLRNQEQKNINRKCPYNFKLFYLRTKPGEQLYRVHAFLK
jgi:hypothetical protein